MKPQGGGSILSFTLSCYLQQDTKGGFLAASGEDHSLLLLSSPPPSQLLFIFLSTTTCRMSCLALGGELSQ